MGRRKSRECAFKVLFQIDMAGSDMDGALGYVAEESSLAPEDEPFARELVDGVLGHLHELDKVMGALSHDWPVKRMPTVDRNVIRLALYEILYRPDIPNNVSANEAVELAKLYGTDESGKFVNGIVGQVVARPEKYSALEL